MTEHEFRQAVYEILEQLIDGAPWTAEREAAAMKLYQLKHRLAFSDGE